MEEVKSKYKHLEQFGSVQLCLCSSLCTRQSRSLMTITLPIVTKRTFYCECLLSL